MLSLESRLRALHTRMTTLGMNTSKIGNTESDLVQDYKHSVMEKLRHTNPFVDSVRFELGGRYIDTSDEETAIQSATETEPYIQRLDHTVNPPYLSFDVENGMVGRRNFFANYIVPFIFRHHTVFNYTNLDTLVDNVCFQYDFNTNAVQQIKQQVKRALHAHFSIDRHSIPDSSSERNSELRAWHTQVDEQLSSLSNYHIVCVHMWTPMLCNTYDSEMYLKIYRDNKTIFQNLFPEDNFGQWPAKHQVHRYRTSEILGNRVNITPIFREVLPAQMQVQSEHLRNTFFLNLAFFFKIRYRLGPRRWELDLRSPGLDPSVHTITDGQNSTAITDDQDDMLQTFFDQNQASVSDKDILFVSRMFMHLFPRFGTIVDALQSFSRPLTVQLLVAHNSYTVKQLQQPEQIPAQQEFLRAWKTSFRDIAFLPRAYEHLDVNENHDGTVTVFPWSVDNFQDVAKAANDALAFHLYKELRLGPSSHIPIYYICYDMMRFSDRYLTINSTSTGSSNTMTVQIDVGELLRSARVLLLDTYEQIVNYNFFVHTDVPCITT